MAIAPNMDKIIHDERIHNREKVTYTSTLNALPDGTMVEIKSKAYLVWNNKLFVWSFSGYSISGIDYSGNDEVIVLTPKSYVKTFTSGFIPIVNISDFKFNYFIKKCFCFLQDYNLLHIKHNIAINRRRIYN
jgi:hypothetical protein